MINAGLIRLTNLHFLNPSWESFCFSLIFVYHQAPILAWRISKGKIVGFPMNISSMPLTPSLLLSYFLTFKKDDYKEEYILLNSIQKGCPQTYLWIQQTGLWSVPFLLFLYKVRSSSSAQRLDAELLLL